MSSSYPHVMIPHLLSGPVMLFLTHLLLFEAAVVVVVALLPTVSMGMNKDTELVFDDMPKRTHSLRVVVFLTQGCSGSSWFHSTLVQAAKLEGYAVYSGVTKECLRPSSDRNRFYEEGICDVECAIVKALHEAEKHADYFFIGAMYDFPDSIAQAMAPWKPTTLFYFRANSLNFVSCQVRDCFNKKVGESVDALGSQSNVCFQRRHSNATNFAKLNPEYLKTSLDWNTKNMNKMIDSMDHLKQYGYETNSPVVYDELMTLFEYDTSGVWTTVMREWEKVLFHVGINPAVAERIMRIEIAKLGIRPYIPSSKRLYNHEEVKNTLEELGPPYSNFYHTTIDEYVAFANTITQNRPS
eukprot:m.10676 g.10676  ORF g.10676 m.10676 type:complete len:354 (-) comp6666_c0_seq1:154-1215(-)